MPDREEAFAVWLGAMRLQLPSESDSRTAAEVGIAAAYQICSEDTMTNPIEPAVPQEPSDPVPLCIWREARGEGFAGMQAVGCVIYNRAKRHQMSMAKAVMVPWAFSSMTAHGDPQLDVYPNVGSASYAQAVKIATALELGVDQIPVVDPTKGATLYYDDSISFPKTWRRDRVEATVKIGRMNFFKEL